MMHKAYLMHSVSNRALIHYMENWASYPWYSLLFKITMQ